MREINLNRQLLGLEDLEFGTGTVEQTRAGTKVNITKINAGNLPFDETRTLVEFAQEVNLEELGNSVEAINNLNNDLDKLLIVEDNLTEVVSVAQNIVPNLTEILNVDTLAAQVTQDKSDVSSMKLAVETIYDTFDDRFLGTKTVDPTLDNDGNALIDGAMYFNTSSNTMKVYDVGTTTWYSIPQIYLSALLDVELTSITTGDILVWNGTKWSNTANPKVDSIQFNGGTGTEGTVSWNSDEGTLDLVANTTTLQIGQETYINAKNQTGNTITDGIVVMAVGTLGASGRILIAPYDGISDPKYILGITTESIVNGSNGKITTFGKIRGLDTSMFAEGDKLFVTTSGGLTNVEPSTGVNIAIAYVINSHASNGTIMVRFTPYDENLSYSKTEIDSSYGNVDNTSDLDKPVSTDTQTALDLKAPLNSATLVNPTINGVAQSGYSGFKNLIVNGRKQVNQSGVTATDNAYNYDNHYKVGNNWFMFIEGLDIESGSEYTLSWEGAATASYYIGTAGRSTINAQSFTPITNGGTITPIITSSQFLWIKFASNSTGSTYNKVQLEKGIVATPFENRLYGLELNLVQRNYEILKYSAYSHHYSGGVASISLYYVTKRIAPIITLGAGSEGLTVSEITVNGLRWFNAAGYCYMAPNTILDARP